MSVSFRDLVVGVCFVLAMSAIVFTSLFPSSAWAVEEDTSGIIEEVVVTSRRRAESVQDVPLSVTAFNAERIEQIKPTTLRDFDGLAPNVYIGMNTAGPGASALYIRGVGYAGIEKTSSPQVGVIVDGVQIGSSTGQLIDAFDIESIEVNRGPQGVLFGKNTTGGNIVVNRVKPQFNDFGFKANAEFGNFDSSTYKARVNIPLIDDTLAIKVGATKREREGYYDNATLGGEQGDVDFEAQTVAVRWVPSDAWDITLTYDRIDDNSEIPPQDPRYDGSNPFVNRADKREPTTYEVDQVGLRVDWDASDRLTIHSITGWHDSTDQVNQDFDGGSLTGGAVPFAQLHTLRTQDYEVFTQELRLDFSVNDDVDLMGGIYYFDSELDFNQRTNNVLQLPGIALGLPAGVPCGAAGLRANAAIPVLCQLPNSRALQNAGEEVDAISYFANVTWRPAPDWELSLGARYIDEEKDGRNEYFDFSDGTYDTRGIDQEFNFTGFPQRPGVNYVVGDEWSDTIIQATATYDIDESSSIYASYSEGFRSGGLALRSARGVSEATFEPEEAYQIEVGTKNEFFDRSLMINLAYFYLEIENAQVASVISLPPGSIPGTTTPINNEEQTTIKGVELETAWHINQNWSVNFNGGFIDLEQDEYTLPCQLVDVCQGVPVGTIRNLGGGDLGRAPEWSANLNLLYGVELENGGYLAANVGVRKVGNFILTQTGGVGSLEEGGYARVDARVQYDFPIGDVTKASVAIFGKNLSDKEWREQALFLGNGAPLADGGPATGFQGWGAPRTYGIEFSVEM